MNPMNFIFPEHVRILLKRLGIAALMLFITRLIFLGFNFESFSNISLYDFVLSIWFDWITIGIFFIPYYLLFLLPLPIRGYKYHRTTFKILFHATNSVLIGLNLMDVEYFKYTSKRSTYDLFSILSAGKDFSQLISTFLKDFWFLFIFLFLLIILSELLYRKTQKKLNTFKNKPTLFYQKNITAFFIFGSILFIIGRGGFNLKPTGIIEASIYTKGKNTALVLTTPFTMIKTIDQGKLEIQEFFSKEKCDQLFSPIKHSQAQNILPDSTNVMVIMLESFGVEFIGSFNEGKGFTPFLDSLINQSLSFNFGFANGKKSIEAVPAIIASMPTLMENPYISSPFGDNSINTLPNLLEQHGYSSAFYHGATNGSMRFDGFAALCGFDDYYGRYEYDNDQHFDKTWGILDEYFNPWTAKKMSELKEPFFSALFTVSSHHPYYIPPHMKNKIKAGPQKICASINYGDYALKEFFKEAKKQPWYNNTLFVILADHTPATKTKKYNLKTNLYHIPILFYHPSGKIKIEKSDKVFQQLDILPTILDLLNIEMEFYAFGNSFYQTSSGEAITYISGSYYYFKDGHMTTFIDKKARNLYNYTIQGGAKEDSISFYRSKSIINENRIKAMLQRYTEDLNLNQTTIK